MRFKELLHAPDQASTSVGAEARRRLGRNDQVSPHLIPLLRNPTTVNIPAPIPGETDISPLGDDLAPMRGIMFGVVLSAPLWAVIAGVVWVVLR